MGTERLEQPHDIWVAIPVFNNKDTVRAVALACRDELPNVLVIDDGSTDADVKALFKDTDVVVLKHDRNQGKGRAILTALRYVHEHCGRYMITVDADGQHDPRDIRKFLPMLADQPAAVVIGARRMNAPNVPRSSRFGMRFSDFWLRLETGVAMKDTQSGFRAYPVEYISKLSLTGNAYDFEAEVLAKAAWAGLTIKSVDIGVTYAPKDKRVSHFRPFLDNLRLTHRHVLLIGRRLLPWPHRRLVPRETTALKMHLRHPIRMLQALLLEHATPMELGMAAAVGTFLATLPLLALHTLVIIYVATRLRLNRVMAVAIQNLCMPPVVPFLCVELGHFMRYGHWLNDLTSETWIHQAPQRVWEWFLGSLVAAPIIAVVTGLLVFGVAAFVRKWSPVQTRLRRAGARMLRPLQMKQHENAIVAGASSSGVRLERKPELEAPATISPDWETLAIQRGDNLPHWYCDQAIYHVSFRLVDSIPKSKLNDWAAERAQIVATARQLGRALSEQEENRLRYLYSEKIEAHLDQGHGECWLRQAKIATLVADASRYFDGLRYDLHAWCIMPNHVHVIVQPMLGNPLGRIVHSWKSYTAGMANHQLGRKGQFWQHEPYDHIIRSAKEYAFQVNYTWENPDKASITAQRWKVAGASSSGVALGKKPEQDAPATFKGTAI